MCLRVFAQTNSLQAVFTFTDSGQTTAWTDATGGEHQLGYILTDMNLATQHTESWIDPTIDFDFPGLPRTS